MSTPSSGCSRFENVALPAGAAGWSLLHTRAACAGQRRERDRGTRGVALCVLTSSQRRPRRALWPMWPWLSAHGSVSSARRRRQQRTLGAKPSAVGKSYRTLPRTGHRTQTNNVILRPCPSLFAPRPSASCIEEHAALRSPVLPGRCLGADRQPAGGARHAAARGSQPDDGVQRWQGWQRWRGSASGQDEAGAREGADPGGASPASRASPCLAAEPCHRSRLDVATACCHPSPCLPPPTSAASATRSLPALTAHLSPAGGRCGQGQGDPSLRADGAAAP